MTETLLLFGATTRQLTKLFASGSALNAIRSTSPRKESPMVSIAYRGSGTFPIINSIMIFIKRLIEHND